MANDMRYEDENFMFRDKVIADDCCNPELFTYRRHGVWLEDARGRGYSFIGMSDRAPHDKFIVLQHNVNYSLPSALPVAYANYEHDVRATFFINTESPFYSLSDCGDIGLIREITEMNHSLGVLVSPRDENGEMLSHDGIARKARACIEHLGAFDITVEALAFDIVGPDAKRLAAENVVNVPGVRNVYDHTFANGVDCQYISSSNGLFLYGTTPFTAIQDKGAEALHVLAHTDWLTREPKLPYDRLKEHVDPKKWGILEDVYLQHVYKGGRCVVGDGKIPEIDEHVRSVLSRSQMGLRGCRRNEGPQP